MSMSSASSNPKSTRRKLFNLNPHLKRDMRKPILVVRMVVQSVVGASLTVINAGSGKLV